MKLTHTVTIAEGLCFRQDLSSNERAALFVLTKMSRRVLGARRSLRAVVRAVYGEDLNQVEMGALFKGE